MNYGIKIFIFLTLALFGCEEGELREQRNRPTEGGAVAPGFDLETIESVEAKKAAIITIGKTTLTIPEGALEEKVEVRLRTLKDKPNRELVASLGEAKGDVVEITIYDKVTDEIFASNVLSEDYELRQSLAGVEDEQDLKYVVISCPGCADERIDVVGSSALTTSLALATNPTVSLSLTITHAIIYAVESTEAPSAVVIINDTKSLSSDGGTAASSSSSSSSSSSTSSSSGGGAIDCSGLAGGVWIGVPGNTTAGLGGEAYTQGTKTDFEGNVLATADFCVMKYEAKKVDVDGTDTAVSQAIDKPWVSIVRDDAQAKCANLGVGYTLVNNAMWQAIARNIETALDSNLEAPNNYSNWQNNSISGNNSLNRGNSNYTAALAADVDDDNGCSGITSNGAPNEDCSSTWHVNKRTHRLSNGEVIWDLAGNVSEWVIDGNNEYQGGGGNNYISENPTPGKELKWGTSHDYSSIGEYPKLNPEYGGLGYFFDFNTGIARGGHWLSSVLSGVFSVHLGKPPSSPGIGRGFRCGRPAN